MSNKRTNKTSHVLNLLTNRTGLPGNEAEHKPEPHLRGQEAAALSASSAIPEPMISFKPEEILTIDQSPVEVVPAVESPRVHRPDAATQILKNLEKAVVEKKSEFQSHPPASDFQPSSFSVFDSAVQATDVLAEKISEPTIHFFSPKLPNAGEQPADLPPIAEVQQPQQPQHSIHENLYEYEYIYMNILEDIVQVSVLPIMKKFHMCMCNRCVNDVIAYTLNQLPPKYVVTSDSLYLKAASYEKRHSVDIIAAITQACLAVQQHPRHD